MAETGRGHGRSDALAGGQSSLARRLVAVFGSMAAMATFYGYTGPLLSLVLADRGVSGVLIGFSGAVQMAAVFVVLPFVPAMIRRVGPANIMLFGSLLAVASLALMGLWVDVWAWFPLRLLTGASQSMMWTAGEIWINHMSSDRVRGRTVSLFMMCVAGGFAVGPFLLAEVGIRGDVPFLAGMAVMAAGLLPLLACLRERMAIEGRPSVRLPQYLRLAPLPMLSNLGFAAISGAMMHLFVVYAMRLDVAQDEAARMMGWMGWGGVLMPLLIGYLADRMDRLLLLMAFATLGALATLALPWLPLMVGWSILYLMVFGGLRAGHYGLNVMLLGDRFRGADLPSATAVFGVMFGIGSLLGPALGGIAMDAWDPHGLPLVVGLLFLAMLSLSLSTWHRRRSRAR